MESNERTLPKTPKILQKNSLNKKIDKDDGVQDLDAIARLKKIGTKQINIDTKISVDRIEAILQRRYGELQQVWVRNFLGIFEREYGVDMSAWLTDYEAFIAQNHDIAEPTNIITLNERSRKNKKVLKTRKRRDHRRSKYFFQMIFVIMIIIAVFLLFMIFNTPKIDETPLKISPQNGASDNAQILKNDKIIPENPAAIESLQEIPREQSFERRKISSGHMLIIPQRNLWFQVISGRDPSVTKDRLIKEALMMKIPQDGDLMLFGHKIFEIEYPDRVEKFGGGDSGYFIVQNGHLKAIPKAEFLQITAPKIQKSPENTELEPETDLDPKPTESPEN